MRKKIEDLFPNYGFPFCILDWQWKFTTLELSILSFIFIHNMVRDKIMMKTQYRRRQ